MPACANTSAHIYAFAVDVILWLRPAFFDVAFSVAERNKHVTPRTFSGGKYRTHEYTSASQTNITARLLNDLTAACCSPLYFNRAYSIYLFI